MELVAAGHRRQLCQWLGLWSALLLCAGCWQEVHYDPDKADVESPVRQTVATEDVDKPASDSPATETPEVLEPSPGAGHQPGHPRSGSAMVGEPAAEVTTEDLFGTSLAPPVADTDQEAEEAETQEKQASDVESLRFAARDSAVAAGGLESPEIGSMAGEEIIHEEPSPDPEIEPMRPSRVGLAAWRMASRWSLAAAIYAKGQPEEQYRDILAQATYAAELAGAELPDLPTAGASDLEATVISFLLASNPIAFDDQLAPEYQSLTELAIKTHLLLLVYTPKTDELEPLISSIRHAAENSGLPSELWSELLSMLVRREPFADVKREVFTLHQRVGDYLAGDAG